MVVKADQEKIRALLKDTITLLCKNGLAYNAEFCVEALIGITLDKDDVFLVSINETIKSPCPDSPELDEIVVEHGEESAAPLTNSRRRKRHRNFNNSQDDAERDSGGGGEEDTWDLSSLGGAQDESSSQSDMPPAKRFATMPKKERDESDSKDTIVIKEEIDDWTGDSCAQEGPLSGMHGDTGPQSEDIDLQSVLQSGALVPVPSQANQALWTEHQQAGNSRTSTLTSNSAQGDFLDQQQMKLQPPPIPALTRPLPSTGEICKWPWICETQTFEGTPVPLAPGSSVMLYPHHIVRADNNKNIGAYVKELLSLYFKREQLAQGSYLGKRSHRPIDRAVVDAIVARTEMVYDTIMPATMISKLVNDKCHDARTYMKGRLLADSPNYL